MKFIKYLLFLFALLLAIYALSTKIQERPMQTPAEKSLKLGIVLFKGFDQLDVTAPLEVFNRFPDTQIYFIANTMRPVSSHIKAITIKPNTTFDTAPQMDILFIPGGTGLVKALKNDKALVHFIQGQTPQLKYLSSVCTGALILGYAGELKDYRATTHWMAKKYLTSLGAIPVDQRVVVDRNRVTGAGVSSGLDLALQLGELLFGKSFFEKEELLIEYFNQPVLYNTSVETADPEAKEALQKEMGNVFKERDDFFR